MNKIPNLLFILLLISRPAFPQNKGPIQGPTLGIHFLFHDFKTASAIGTDGSQWKIEAFKDKPMQRMIR